ncbi:outer membrane protein assembly factor BamB [Salinivibrio siamensis]|uniref:Outer membrane protein assembly factor BamB n=1 Tax=Salinivibrio siamensis TaxID=414286 RepID=A0ABX3KBN7_9GAMM|nr:outer membrane protein assembly factor BamB [Salinivibrio siamensis]OOE86319.1 outer membrane protein assembly factor BamB [Salinivibrio siamensis]
MKKRLWRMAAMATTMAVLAGCAGEEDVVQMAPLPSVTNEISSTQHWRAQVGDGVGQYYSALQPTVAYDKVFAADRQGLVAAFDLESGESIWQQSVQDETPALLSGGLSASYGKVYVGGETGQVYALDAETGERVWQHNVNGEVLAKPLVEAGLVIVNTSRGELVALDAESGEPQWNNTNDVPNLSLRGESAPVTISGGVFWGMANGRLGAAMIETGRSIWQIPISTPKGATEIDRLVDVDATPVIDGDRLYAVGYNGQLVSIDLRSGKAAWKRDFSSAKDFLVAGNSIYLIDDKDNIVALDARNGLEKWRNTQLAYRILTAPAASGGYLVVGDSQGYLHWLDPQTGDFVAQQSLEGNGIAVAPVQTDDGYIVITRDGQLRKLSIE